MPEESTSNCFENNVSEVSPYMLGCCIRHLFLIHTLLSYAERNWKHENYIFGQSIYKQSYKGFFFNYKKGARLSACLLAPDQRF